MLLNYGKFYVFFLIFKTVSRSHEKVFIFEVILIFEVVFISTILYYLRLSLATILYYHMQLKKTILGNYLIPS